MDLEATLIQRVVRETKKLEADLMALAPAPRGRVLARKLEEVSAMADRLKDAK